MESDSKTVKLETLSNHIPTFVICLAIGTLQAILEDTISAEVGIWTLGRPRTWEFLAEEKLVSEEVISVLQTCDEISFIKEQSQERFENVVKELITQLKNELKKIEEPNWLFTWSYSNKSVSELK